MVPILLECHVQIPVITRCYPMPRTVLAASSIPNGRLLIKYLSSLSSFPFSPSPFLLSSYRHFFVVRHCLKNKAAHLPAGSPGSPLASEHNLPFSGGFFLRSPSASPLHPSLLWSLLYSGCQAVWELPWFRLFFFHTFLPQTEPFFIHGTDNMVSLLVLIPISPLCFPSSASSLFTFHAAVEHFIPLLLEVFRKFRWYHRKTPLYRVMRGDSVWEFQIISQKFLVRSPKHLHFHPVIRISKGCKKRA